MREPAARAGGKFVQFSKKLGAITKKFSVIVPTFERTSKKNGAIVPRLSATTKKLSAIVLKLGSTTKKLGAIVPRLGATAQKHGAATDKLEATIKKYREGISSYQLPPTDHRLPPHIPLDNTKIWRIIVLP